MVLKSESRLPIFTSNSQRQTSQEKLVDLDEALSNDMCLESKSSSLRLGGDLDPEV